MKLKPAEGRAVRDPVKRTLLPADGAEVAPDTFWRRRLRDGDVVEATDVAEVTPPRKAPLKPATPPETQAQRQPLRRRADDHCI